MADGASETAPEEELIIGLAKDRREGRDTTQDVQELLKRAARANRAALDRLARQLLLRTSPTWLGPMGTFGVTAEPGWNIQGQVRRQADRLR